jgi:hypothetical protein
LIQRKKCNIKLNNKKTGQNKAGQTAIKERYAREDGVWLKKGEAGNAAGESESAEQEEQAEQAEQVVSERSRKRARPNPFSDSSPDRS